MKKIFSWIYGLIPCVALFAAEDASFHKREDSLLSLLKADPAFPAQIDLYRSLAGMYWQQPEETAYLRKMAEVAAASRSYPSVYEAWTTLCRHYYNRQHRDSLIYWAHCIDSLAISRNETPDALFESNRNPRCCVFLLPIENIV